jgi:hypothetical protein
VCFLFFARETAGASRIRHSLRPLNFRCALLDAQLARITRRDRGGAGVCTSPRLRGEVEAKRLRVRGPSARPNAWKFPLTPTLSPQAGRGRSGADDRRSGRNCTMPSLRRAGATEQSALHLAPSLALAMTGSKCILLLVIIVTHFHVARMSEAISGTPSAIQALGAATAPRAPRWRYRQYRCGHRTPLA